MAGDAMTQGKDKAAKGQQTAERKLNDMTTATITTIMLMMMIWWCCCFWVEKEAGIRRFWQFFVTFSTAVWHHSKNEKSAGEMKKKHDNNNKNNNNRSLNVLTLMMMLMLMIMMMIPQTAAETERQIKKELRNISITWHLSGSTHNIHLDWPLTHTHILTHLLTHTHTHKQQLKICRTHFAAIVTYEFLSANIISSLMNTTFPVLIDRESRREIEWEINCVSEKEMGRGRNP